MWGAYSDDGMGSSDESSATESAQTSDGDEFDMAFDDYSDDEPRKTRRTTKRAPTAPRQTTRSGTRQSANRQYVMPEVDMPRVRKQTKRYGSDDEYEAPPSYTESYREPMRTSFSETTSSSSSDSEDSSDEERVKEEYDGPQVEKIIGWDDSGEEKKYIAKYKNESYRSCRYLTEEELSAEYRGTLALKSFRSNVVRKDKLIEVDGLMLVNDLKWPNCLNVSRVIAYDRETGKYLVVWDGLEYKDATWETEVGDDDALREFEEREGMFEVARRMVRPYGPTLANFRLYGTDEDEIRAGRMLPIPTYKNGRELFDYQVEGLNWLRNCWYSGRSSILADEMGLGKTVQCVCMVKDIYDWGARGPFLVIAPVSTLVQWEREFKLWTDLNVLNYHAGKESRQLIHQWELYWDGCRDMFKFDVLLLNDAKLLFKDDETRELIMGTTWEYMIVDEAHMSLKNHEGKKYQHINSIPCRHKLLMTGTPIQNHVKELWSLLHFIDAKFHGRPLDDLEWFIRQYDPQCMKDLSDEQHKERIQDLQTELRRYWLHRRKDDIEETIGEKEEIIVEVHLTRTQKRLYRQFLEEGARNYVGKKSVSNIPMQLRKVCNHPYLFRSKFNVEIDPKEQDENEGIQHINVCGKLLFVDKLLVKLRAEGAKVLLFSQMKIVLDELASYCMFRGYKYERIDGGIAGGARQDAMDRFNNPNDDVFLFLCTTKAGGVGLNLTAATYVIIYDCDWNPQNDVQAEARCHRIGQKNDVKVFRLVSKYTYEEEMFERASQKLGLGELIMGGDDSDKLSAKDIKTILQKGIYHMKETNDDELEKFQSENIDEILKNRARSVKVGSSSGGKFSKAVFTIEDDPETKKVIKENWKHKKWEINEDLKLQKINQATGSDLMLFDKRKRKQVNRGDDEFDDDIAMDSWNKSNREKIYTNLLRYGWGRWDRVLKGVSFSGDQSELIDGCVVMVYMMCVIIDKSVYFSVITGQTDLTTHQAKMARKEPFNDKEFKDKLTRDAERASRQLIELNTVGEYMEKHKKEAPEVKTSKEGWTRADDTKLLKSMWKHGRGKWDRIYEDFGVADRAQHKKEQEQIRKRLEKLINRIMELDEKTTTAKKEKEKQKKESKKEDKKKESKKEDKKKESKKEKKKEEKKAKREERDVEEEEISPSHPPAAKPKAPPQTKTRTYESLIFYLQRYGTPVTEEQWEIFTELTGMEDARIHTTEILDAVHEMLCGHDLPDDHIVRAVLNYRSANDLKKLMNWFDGFRNFYVNQLGTIQDLEQKLADMECRPGWWNHLTMDMKLFEHIFRFGTLRPASLLSEHPFINEVSDVDRLNDAIEEERISLRPAGSYVDPKFFILLDDVEVRSRIDNIIHDLFTTSTEKLRITLERKDRRYEVPKTFNETVIETIGNGEFRTYEGYLYRVGFQSRVTLNNIVYRCNITENCLCPFSIRAPKSSSVMAPSPAEAFVEAGVDIGDKDPYVLFGIGIPAVRYWLQDATPKGKVITGYIEIEFEISKESTSEQRDTGGFSLVPKRRKGGMFPPIPRP